MFELIKLLLQLGRKVIFSPENNTKQEPYYSTLVNMGVWVLNKPAFQKSSKAVIKRVIPWVNTAVICRRGMNRKYGRFIKKRSEEHTSELQTLMRISYTVLCLKQKEQQ